MFRLSRFRILKWWLKNLALQDQIRFDSGQENKLLLLEKFFGIRANCFAYAVNRATLGLVVGAHQ